MCSKFGRGLGTAVLAVLPLAKEKKKKRKKKRRRRRIQHNSLVRRRGHGSSMGLTISNLWTRLFSNKEMRILMGEKKEIEKREKEDDDDEGGGGLFSFLFSFIESYCSVLIFFLFAPLGVYIDCWCFCD